MQSANVMRQRLFFLPYSVAALHLGHKSKMVGNSVSAKRSRIARSGCIHDLAGEHVGWHPVQNYTCRTVVVGSRKRYAGMVMFDMIAATKVEL